MTGIEEKRRHPRCSMDRQIIFSHGSQEEFYPGLARNHSRYSLYFESQTRLVPGTLLFIRAVGGELPETSVSNPGQTMQSPTSVEPVSGNRRAGACSELKSQVVGQVRRCVEIFGSGETTYGTGVEYVSPAV